MLEFFIEYFAFFFALITYSVVFFFFLILKIGARENGMSVFNLMHLRMSLLYCVLSVIYLFYSQNFSVVFGANFIIGLFFYFGFHYAIMLNFYGITKRSISTALLGLLWKEGGTCSKVKLTQIYQKEFYQRSLQSAKLHEIEKLGWVQVNHSADSISANSVYSLTAKGRLIIKIVLFLLKLFNQKQLKQ